MGNEIKRDMCPEKYYKSNGFIKDIIPSIIAIAFVAYFSGSFMKGAGFSQTMTIVYDIIVFVSLYGFVYFITSGSKKRLAQTYISVCESGVHGVYPVNGFKNENFALSYSEITKITNNKDKMILYVGKKKITVFLTEPEATVALIRSMCPYLQ